MNARTRRLPHEDDRIFLTDAGLETTLIFLKGIELPEFASFALLATEDGTQHIAEYYRQFARMGVNTGSGFILESPTWRANPSWACRLGYGSAELDRLNRRAIRLMRQIRDEFESPATPFLISGDIGPRGDGYRVEQRMSTAQARAYHGAQVEILALSGADMITAMTMNYVEEAAGIALAARDSGIPVVISFTSEIDGLVPDGSTLGDAISAVDALTDSYPSYFMINCAHPDHFTPILDSGSPWIRRLQGIRANASRCSHAELDEATELDSGDPHELGALYAGLQRKLPWLNVFGGCCGTDHRHIAAIAASCRSPSPERGRGDTQAA